MSEYAIEMLHITKTFSGVRANDDIVLQVKKGEIHALLGENGAGKSTLVSVLFGMYEPDDGKILLNGTQVQIHSPRQANDLGIGMVHQHFMLVKNFTVLENIMLGAETVRYGELQMKEAGQKAGLLSEKYGLRVDLDTMVSDISVGMQQRVEILKMLYRNADILIFDEPTAVLTPQEIDELMAVMRNLAKEGKSIIFITHKLDEIKRVAGRCTVLRRGKYIGTVDVKTSSKGELSEMMVGRKVDLHIKKKEPNPGPVVLEIKDLHVRSQSNKSMDVVKGVSLAVRGGEIVGIAGIEGNGQSELTQAISGLLPAASGSIRIAGTEITHSTIRYRNTHGLSYIPEDRHKYGLILDSELAENLALKQYFTKGFQDHYFIKFSYWRQYARQLIDKYDIRCGKGPETAVRSMSGGNQQKAIIAREIELDQDLILAMQLTRGLDVGAIEAIHYQLLEQRDKGKGVLLVSYELDEIVNISDRILVLYEGEIAAELLPQETTAQEIGLFMAGSKMKEA